MHRRLLSVAAVASLVLLAGCAGLVGNGEEAGPNETDGVGDTPASTATPTATAASTPTPTATEAGSRVPDWQPPSPPNLPLQHKSDEEGANRMHTLEVREGIESADGAYSSFVVEMQANTSMPHVDPPEHGTPRGEPYFLVYVDGEIEFNATGGHVDGTLVERSAIVGQKENGTFAMWVPAEGMEEKGIEPGEHEILVVLMDEDSEYDDIYGWKTTTVDYAPRE